MQSRKAGGDGPHPHHQTSRSLRPWQTVIRDPSDGSVKEINPAPNENKKVGVKTPSEGITVESIRIIKHEAVPGCGSFEVRFPDRPSQYFYWDDNSGRRSITHREAEQRAKELARTEQEKY
jgi:hypothetical protein